MILKEFIEGILKRTKELIVPVVTTVFEQVIYIFLAVEKSFNRSIKFLTEHVTTILLVTVILNLSLSTYLESLIEYNDVSRFSFFIINLGVKFIEIVMVAAIIQKINEFKEK